MCYFWIAMKNQTHPVLEEFLQGKSETTCNLLYAFVAQYETLAPVTIHGAKTMIGIANENNRIAWITQLGKNFVHVVFPFRQPYPDNLCFQKIAQVPGDDDQFNHHLRLFAPEDLNAEVLGFMQLAWDEEKA
jgi:hypothetical protein